MTCMISPLMRQSFLLSSSTVFMFSIQTASTGPSNRIHLRSRVNDVAYSRNAIANTPSDLQHANSAIINYNSIGGRLEVSYYPYA